MNVPSVTKVRAAARAAPQDRVMALFRKLFGPSPAGNRRSQKPRFTARGELGDPALAIARQVRAIDQAGLSAQPRLAALEAFRPLIMSAVEPMVRALREQPIPYSRDELARFDAAWVAMAVTRDAMRRVYTDLCLQAGPDTHGRSQPRAMLALVWALEMQSLLLTSACRLRMAMERAEWDELCRLTYPLWRASMLDEVFPDASGAASGRYGASASPRALFALPLLMRLLEPLGLDGVQTRLAFRLARRLAPQVGVRIELDGLPHVSDLGPALMMSNDHTVELDTGRGLAEVLNARALADATESARLRGVLTTEALDTLLGHLWEVWGPGYQPTQLVMPPVSQAVLHVGLPRAFSLHEDGLIELDGEPVAWRGLDTRRSVFARMADFPRLQLGQLVVVQPRAAVGPLDNGPSGTSTRTRMRPGSGPTGLLAGRVVTLGQAACGSSRQPFGHDVGVAFWPGSPRPVRVLIGHAGEPEPGWWLAGNGSDAAPSLLVRPGACDRADRVELVEGDGTHVLRSSGLIERGLDYERVALEAAA